MFRFKIYKILEKYNPYLFFLKTNKRIKPKFK